MPACSETDSFLAFLVRRKSASASFWKNRCFKLWNAGCYGVPCNGTSSDASQQLHIITGGQLRDGGAWEPAHASDTFFLTVSNAQPLPSWACAWQRLWTISRQSGPGQSDAKLIHCHFPQGSSFLNRATLVSSCPVRGRHMQKRVLASDWPHAVPPRRAACSMELQSELTVMSFSATLNSALHYKPSARGGLSGTR